MDTSASALQQKKEKVFRKNFQAISRKNRFPRKFSGAPQTFINSNNIAILELRTGKFLKTRGQELCSQRLHLYSPISKVPLTPNRPVLTAAAKMITGMM